MAALIDGKAIAQEIKNELKEKVAKIASSGKRVPCLSVILIGDDPASHVYVNYKEKACHQIGVTSKIVRLPASTPEKEVLSLVHQFNANDDIDGILIQLPLPKHINRTRVIRSITPHKDVDGLVPENQGLLAWNLAGLRPCTPSGIMQMLKKSDIPVEGKRVVVIGRSILVGNPVAQMLIHANATVTVVHSKTSNPDVICKEADILIVAAGKHHLVKRNWVKEGAIVVDVGIHRIGKKLRGDVDFDAVLDKVKAITPVPGGVGPMTIAMLLSNCVTAYENP